MGLQSYKSGNNSDIPLITIITVVLNNPAGLKKTVESVLSQTYKNIECIIIDRGSAKSTLDVIKEYESRIHYQLSKPYKGVYDAMNKGIEFATGDYINFMNADNWFCSKNTIQNIFSQQHGGADFIYGDTICRYDRDVVKYCNALTVDDLWKYMIFFHQSSFIKKTIFERQKFDLKYKICSDYELIYDAFNNGARFFKTALPVSVYYKNVVSKQKIIRQYVENWLISGRFNNYQGFNRSHLSLIPKLIYKKICAQIKRQTTWNMQMLGQRTVQDAIDRGFFTQYFKKRQFVAMPLSEIGHKCVVKHGLITDEHTGVVIYQHGKVGSTSILYSLKKSLSCPVYRIHSLAGTRNAEKWHKNNNFARLPAHLLISKALRNIYEKYSSVLKWKIITLARDPVAQNLSAIFQNLREKHSELIIPGTQKIDMERATRKISNMFRNMDKNKRGVLDYFDREFKDFLGIDIYAYPFNDQKGYSVIKDGNIEILIMKFERLSEIFSRAIEDFLGIKKVKLPKKNVTKEKSFGPEHAALKKRLKLPKEVLQSIYTSQYVRHFYPENATAGGIGGTVNSIKF